MLSCFHAFITYRAAPHPRVRTSFRPSFSRCFSSSFDYYVSNSSRRRSAAIWKSPTRRLAATRSVRRSPRGRAFHGATARSRCCWRPHGAHSTLLFASRSESDGGARWWRWRGEWGWAQARDGGVHPTNVGTFTSPSPLGARSCPNSELSSIVLRVMPGLTGGQAVGRSVVVPWSRRLRRKKQNAHPFGRLKKIHKKRINP